MLTVDMVPVRTETQVERVRELRNGGRSGLFDQHEVTTEEQRLWWGHGGHRLWLARVGDEDCGYLFLRPYVGKDGDVVTLVVDKARRGEGIGTAIYASAAEMARGPAWAVMWRWNTWSQRAARHAGYVEWLTLSHGTVRVMRHGGRDA
jgi:GNAT superfamily N-acetyltransferase